MKQDQPTLASLSNDFLKYFTYTFTYFPVTSWQRFFNPTVNIGCNMEDAPIEQHVVDQVGSYGYQLNRVLDVLEVLVGRLKEEELTPQEKGFVYEFKKLAEEADRASAEAKGDDARHKLTRASMDEFLDEVRSLQHSNPALYQELASRVVQALGTPGPENPDGPEPPSPPSARAKGAGRS